MPPAAAKSQHLRGGRRLWELIGHLMAASLSPTLPAEEVGPIITASLRRQRSVRSKDPLFALTSDSFNIMLFYSRNVT